MGRKQKQPRCHCCHRRAIRWLERRQRYMCDSCGKVFDVEVVERHNPGLIPPQMELKL